MLGAVVPLMSALVLSAANAPACHRMLESIEQAPPLRQMKVHEPAVYPKFEAHFRDGCAKLPAADLSCAKKHPDARDMLKSCPGVLALLKRAVLAPDVTDPKKLAAFRLRAMESEARANLKAILVAGAAYYQENEALPPAVGPTPSVACCKQPGGRCPAGAKGWDAPTWRKLGFRTYDPTRYRYSFRPTGSGKHPGFVARAEGDPTCTGKSEVWEITATDLNGQMKMGAPTRVR